MPKSEKKGLVKKEKRKKKNENLPQKKRTRREYRGILSSTRH